MADTAPARTLADKLDHLFRSVHPGRHEYSYEEVAATIRSTGVTISHTYVWQLRKGLRDNPTIRHLEALADFFGVPVAYFVSEDEAAKVDRELAVLTAMRDASVRKVALRAAGLSAESLGTITEVIERVRQLEGLKNDQ